MPVRTFNYTDRQKIRLRDVSITLREENSRNIFDIIFNLENYSLPSDAHIFVEAYRQTQYMRFNFGKVSSIRVPVDRTLIDFDSVEGILFRLKVVSNTDPHGLLLAEADQIRPNKIISDEDNRIPLLPVVPDENMWDEIWRIEFDDQQTLLKINSSLGDWKALARDQVFISLVYPAAYRTILSRILLHEKYYDYEDDDDWRSRWLKFTVNLPGVSSPPIDDDEIEIDEWIDSASTSFCRYQNIRYVFEKYWTEGQQK